MMTTDARPLRLLPRAMPRLLPRSMDLLLVWHGLFAGASVIAYLTAEAAESLHAFAGYAVIGLLALRLAIAALVPGGGLWGLPWAPRSLWRAFAGKVARGEIGAALRGRTPFMPLTGLVLLGWMVVVSITGLAADWLGWEDLHEGPAEASLALMAAHVAVVSLGPLMRRLAR